MMISLHTQIPNPEITDTTERFMLSLQKEGGYRTPPSIQDAEARKARLVAELQDIDARLAQMNALTASRRLPNAEFAALRTKRADAVRGKAVRLNELKWIKLWIQVWRTKNQGALPADATDPLALLRATHGLLALLKQEEIDFSPEELKLIETVGAFLSSR